MKKIKLFSILALLLMAATGAVAQTETLLTTITATGKEQANYSTEGVATVSFSYTAYGSSAYLANWGWWGYGWSATVNAAEGYTITKCVFYDDQNRTATDSEAPFVVETTEEDKTPQVNGTPILAYTSKGIKKIDVYGYENPTTVNVTGITLSQTEAAMTVGGETLTLTATVAPDDATDKTVTWTSSDPTVATVADGVVTAVAAGTATITATATNGTDDTTDDKTATCTITVTDPDQAAAGAVVALFDALPVADAVTLNDKEAIEAARAAYDALTDEQKALVTPEDLAKLTAAEEALAAAEKAAADQEAADAVVALFDALPADITLEDKAAIEAARAAYEALTDEQKALVTPEDLAKLTAAEAALAALESNGVENVQGDRKNTKVLNNGHIYILRGDKIYTVQGQEIK